MDLQLRPVSAGGLEDFARAEARANGWHATQEYVVHGQHSVAPDRTLAAFDGEELVGTSVSHQFEMRVPGPILPLAGLGWVSVQPTHRRRGIMTEMMQAHLEVSHERNEPLSGLWSLQGGLYGRYGYAVSAFSEDWTIDRRRASLRTRPSGRSHLISLHTPESHRRFPAVYEDLQRNRIGVVSRSEIFWDVEFEDRNDQRHGRSGYFFVGSECNSELDGYLKYRINSETGELTVSELIANSLDAYVGLWDYLFGLERIRTIRAANRPVDDPLPRLLADSRAMSRALNDAMWLRLVDVKSALEQRHYHREGRVIFELRDRACPWNDGCFELETSEQGVSCASTTKSPEISLDVSELGAVYLGGSSTLTLHNAGLVEEHRDGAVRRMTHLFWTPERPWTVHVF